MGGISLVRQLLFAGLMDELNLITHPVVAGEGRHLFEPGDPTTRLELVRVEATLKGNVVQVYRKRTSRGRSPSRASSRSFYRVSPL